MATVSPVGPAAPDRRLLRSLPHLAAAALAAGALFGSGARAEGGSNPPDDEPPTVEDVDQRVRILERKAEIATEEAAARAKDTVTAGAGKDGFFLKSADGQWQIKLRGYIQFDGRSFTEDDQQPGVDTFTMRRIRPIVEGTLAKSFDFRIMPDFGGGTVSIQDAYLDARFSPRASVRAGKFKPPVGLERLQSGSDLVFVERGLPTNLVPNHDLGVQVHGELARGALSYQVGVFNGVPDGASADGDTNNSKDLVARVFALPFKNAESRALRGLGFGVAASRGKNRGTPSATGLAGFRSASQATCFSYRADSPATAAGTVVGNGSRTRLSGQGYYHLGRFGALAEYVASSQDALIGATSRNLDHRSWQGVATFMLTRDKASFKAVSPRKPLDLGGDGAGAFELAARIGALDVDDAAFPVFANPATSCSAARAWGAGLNWYLTRNVKFMLDYEQTRFAGGAAGGADREDEKIFFTRMQISY